MNISCLLLIMCMRTLLRAHHRIIAEKLGAGARGELKR